MPSSKQPKAKKPRKKAKLKPVKYYVYFCNEVPPDQSPTGPYRDAKWSRAGTFEDDIWGAEAAAIQAVKSGSCFAGIWTTFKRADSLPIGVYRWNGNITIRPLNEEEKLQQSDLQANGVEYLREQKGLGELEDD